jgi:hypothetical protein
MTFNFSADSIITAYGPQIDDVLIDQVDSRTAVAQETFDPGNVWNGSAQFSSDNPAIPIGSPTLQNNGAESWSSPPHYGYDYSYGPTFNGFNPFDDTWAIDDVDGTQICVGWVTIWR